MTRARSLAIAILLAVLVVDETAGADDWTTPQPVSVKSPDGRWRATVTPATNAKSPAQATVQNQNGRAVGFPLRTPWMAVDVVLLDDGTLVTFDQWHSLGYGEVVVAHGPDGRVRWARTLEALVGKARVDGFSHSVSSIWWRSTPLVWSLEPGGDALLVRLRDENQLRIRLSDGAATMVLVAQLPDDAVRLANRADALSRQGQLAQAATLLQRATRLKPEESSLHLRLVEALQELGRNDQATQVGIAAVKRFSGRAAEALALANLQVVLARSQATLGRFAEAEASLRAAVAVTPTYERPSLELAEFLIKRGRPNDADPVLSALASRTAGANGDNYSLLSVGDFYRRNKQPGRARDYYAKGFRPDRVTNQFLYQALAEVNEELGDRAAALAIYQQLAAHFAAHGTAFKAYLDAANRDVERLARAKP